MELKDVWVPGISAILAIGASMATVTATAQNADELADELAA